jgi:hypothetical protein
VGADEKTRRRSTGKVSKRTSAPRRVTALPAISRKKRGAIAHNRSVLEVRTKDAASLDWAVLCCSMSAGLPNRAMHIGAAVEDISCISEESWARVDEAFPVLTSRVLPPEHLRACRRRVVILLCFGEPQYARADVEVPWNALNDLNSLSHM